ncbi:MAG: hypothetical protein RDV48_05185 [Candidatus Eremiobacteraeota bacterium]|nr:hypothetical protein [Candidatus Eremiobacteraeota bacterium]
MSWRKVIFYINVVTITLFFCFLGLLFLWPEYIPFFYLTHNTCRLAIMQLISLMLLLAFFQQHLSYRWKVLCVIASFIVLAEAWLMLELWRF